MELKLPIEAVNSGASASINRTIMELKQGTRRCFILCYFAINRTIMELKLHLYIEALEKKATINRTIMELKHIWNYIALEERQLYQSHHHGIETKFQTRNCGRNGRYQSHHHGIETESHYGALRETYPLSIAPSWN